MAWYGVIWREMACVAFTCNQSFTTFQAADSRVNSSQCIKLCCSTSDVHWLRHTSNDRGGCHGSSLPCCTGFNYRELVIVAKCVHAKWFGLLITLQD